MITLLSKARLVKIIWKGGWSSICVFLSVIVGFILTYLHSQVSLPVMTPSIVLYYTNYNFK